MLPSVLAKAALSVLPAAASPISALLVPILFHVITRREIEFHFSLR